MTAINASLFSNFYFDRSQLWEKASATLDQFLYSPWTRWTLAGGGACLVGYAISRLRAPLVQVDQKLALLGSDPEQLLKLFQELTPLRNHWFYAKRWTALKTHLESYPKLVEPFCEGLIKHQILDLKNDWLSPASELISFDQLSTINKISAEDLIKQASDLARALENPPENQSVVYSALGNYLQDSVTYVGQALHSFASTFLRAHQFSSDENQTLVQRHEAQWHLSNFYNMIEKPAFLIIGVYSFLQPRTSFGWVPYVGTLCFILSAISLIKFFNVFSANKKSVLSNDFRNLTEAAKQGKLPLPLDRAEVVSKMINCFTPLNQDSLSVLLIGPSGVGKDVSVHGFVHELIKFLEDVEVHTTNTSELKESGGGTSHHYVTRMQILLRDLKGKEHHNIVFMNEIHTLNPKKDHIGGYYSELGQQIKTVIETGQLHVIGATTSKEYEEHIKWDDALDRRFVKIFLDPSLNCTEILETYLAEQYPTVTVEKAAIELALTETDKTSPEIAQPAKAKALIAEAARSVLGNYGKQEEELVKLSASLSKERRLLKRDPNNSVKVRAVIELAEEVKQKEAALKTKRQALKEVTDLKNFRLQAHERLARLAHRISVQPEKSCLQMNSLLLVQKLLAETKKTIDEKEDQLDKKGIRIKVDEKLINELLAAKT